METYLRLWCSHQNLTREGYYCPRCNSKQCHIPTHCRFPFVYSSCHDLHSVCVDWPLLHPLTSPYLIVIYSPSKSSNRRLILYDLTSFRSSHTILDGLELLLLWPCVPRKTSSDAVSMSQVRTPILRQVWRTYSFWIAVRIQIVSRFPLPDTKHSLSPSLYLILAFARDASKGTYANFSSHDNITSQHIYPKLSRRSCISSNWAKNEYSWSWSNSNKMGSSCELEINHIVTRQIPPFPRNQ